MDSAEIQPDARQFDRVARALDDEADGREWRADISAELDAALQPAVDEVRSALFGMADGGMPTVGEPLRQAVAAQIVVEQRAGRSVGARIRVRKRGMPRRFWNAPKRLNQRAWRHQVFGADVVVTQVGEHGWFDHTLRRQRGRLREAVERATQERARRITRRV